MAVIQRSSYCLEVNTPTKADKRRVREVPSKTLSSASFFGNRDMKPEPLLKANR